MEKTVLVVDDSSTMRKIIIRHLLMFEEEFAEIIEAENGQVAQEVVEKKKLDLDLIITDIHMPVCDGFEFLEKLKASENSIPVVVITAMGETETVERCKALGTSGFLRKPFTEEGISTMLRMVFRARNKNK